MIETGGGGGGGIERVRVSEGKRDQTIVEAKSLRIVEESRRRNFILATLLHKAVCSL